MRKKGIEKKNFDFMIIKRTYLQKDFGGLLNLTSYTLQSVGPWKFGAKMTPVRGVAIISMR